MKGFFFVLKTAIPYQLKWTFCRCVRNLAGIVFSQTSFYVSSEPSVETFIFETLEDIDVIHEIFALLRSPEENNRELRRTLLRQ